MSCTLLWQLLFPIALVQGQTKVRDQSLYCVASCPSLQACKRRVWKEKEDVSTNSMKWKKLLFALSLAHMNENRRESLEQQGAWSSSSTHTSCAFAPSSHGPRKFELFLSRFLASQLDFTLSSLWVQPVPGVNCFVIRTVPASKTPSLFFLLYNSF